MRTGKNGWQARLSAIFSCSHAWRRNRKKWLAGAAVAAFILLSLSIAWFVGRPLIEYAREPEKFKEWIDSYGLLGRLIYILITTLQVIVAVIPGEPFEIAGGYCFGLLEGTLLCLTGITLGSVIIFMFVRKFGHYFVEIFIKKETMEKMKFLQNPKKLNALTQAFLTFLE